MFFGVTALLVGAYLTGSVNPAVLVSRWQRVDIHDVGSGNPGASNVLRSMGKGTAATVLAADLLKGFLPTLLGALWWSSAVGALAGLVAVVGHCYPIYHRFRGGKGVATAGGALLALHPAVMVVLLVVYGLSAKLTRISAVGSLAAAVVSVPALLVVGADGRTVAIFGAMMLLIVVRHRSNLSRIRSGVENRLV